MTKFNEKKKVAKTTNLAGGKAIKHTEKMELVTAVLSTFLEDKHYESGDSRMDRIKSLVSSTDSEFVAKLAVVARRDFHLRSVSHLLISELAKKNKGNDLVLRTMEKAIERPDDLTEIVALVGKPIPKQIKRGIRHSLVKFSPYQLAKYKQENKKIKLVDLFNIAHPNPKYVSVEVAQAWSDLVNGLLKNEETWEARLSSGEDKASVWKDMLKNNTIGYMALLRNLRNIEEVGDEETITLACNKIASKDEVLKSKQLPFRFFNAYENVKNTKMLSAIGIALDHSLANVPHFDGNTLIAVDGSRTTSGDPIKKASIFAAALFKANDADVVIYDTNINDIKLVSLDSCLTISKQIQLHARAGGTNTSLVFDWARGSTKKYDRIVIISDNESWEDSYYGRGTNASYNSYKKINDCFVYAIDIQGYGTKDVAGAKVHHLTGWSEKIFDFMKWVEKENGVIDMIEAVEL